METLRRKPDRKWIARTARCHGILSEKVSKTTKLINVRPYFWSGVPQPNITQTLKACTVSPKATAIHSGCAAFQLSMLISESAV